MNNTSYKDIFSDKNSIIAVVHSKNIDQTIENVKIAIDNGLNGVFLINHNISGESLLKIFEQTRNKFEKIWIGLNILDFDPIMTFNTIGKLEKIGYKIDGVWIDNPRIKYVNPGFEEQDEIAESIKQTDWKGLYFGGVDFKYQPKIQDKDLNLACDNASKYLDVLTTSGPATGKAADPNRVKTIKNFSTKPIGLASGVTQENIQNYTNLVDVFLVASSLLREGDIYNFDPKKVSSMSGILKDLNKS